MGLPPLDQRHQYLRVQVFDFGGLPDLMADRLSARMLMKHMDAEARRRLSWRKFILALGLHTDEKMQAIRFGAYWVDSARDLILRLCHMLIACSIAGRSQAPKKERLRGLTVIIPELPIIDMAELVRLQICIDIDDTWDWVAMGPKRQPDAVAGAPGVAQDTPAV
nr:hypothetical protein [Tanacetum cinerariifolium]